MRHTIIDDSRLRQAPPPDEVSRANAERLWRRSSQVALIIIAVIALGSTLVAARAVMIPIVSAIIIGSVIGPAIEALGKRGIPTLPASVALVAILLVACYGAAVAVAGPLAEWIDRAPEIGERMQERFAAFQPAIRSISSFFDAISSVGRPPTPPIPVDIVDSTMLQSLMTVVTPAIGEFIIFVGSLIFFLAGRARIKGKVVQAMGSRSVRLGALRVFRAIETQLGAYLVTATFINMGLGVATGLMSWAVGLPNAPLWGVLAFLLNYIPYLGPAMVTTILAVAGIISFPSLLHGLLPAAIFVLFTTVEGQILMPLIVGRRVALNPFSVFLSMAVWTWLWGPAGTFLAVPLLIAGKSLLAEVLAARRPQLPG